MAEKLQIIWQHKIKSSLMIIAAVLFVLVQVPLIAAYEAHVINVTATIVQPCDEYFIAGYKFFDHNQDGIKDEGEQGLAGWIVELEKIFDERYDYDSSGDYTQNDIDILTDVADNLIECPQDKRCHWNNDGWVDSQDVALFEGFLASLPRDLGNRLTNANGYYEFRNLEPGVHIVNEVTQDDWTPTTPTQHTVTLSYSQCDAEINFGNFQESRECSALSIGYWQNHAGCPDSSIWADDINNFSSSMLLSAFAGITGTEICEALAPKNCPKGNTLESSLCKATGKALADLTNIVAGNLDANAVIAGAYDGSDAFINLGLNSNSTIKEALLAIEGIINAANSIDDLKDANHVGERIYSFYEDENPQFPACLFTWTEPEPDPLILGAEIEPILGCMDETAQNYNPNATEDNNNCKYKIAGCTNETALNYNPEATKDDKSCKYEVLLASIPGCTDETALNYNIEATDEDGTCEYEQIPADIPGCMDEIALNYNPEATKDDKSCEYEVLLASIPGCMDEIALDYNPEATVDDGSCTYPEPPVPNEVEGEPILGCMDELALNYNIEVTEDDGSCTYPEPEPEPTPEE